MRPRYTFFKIAVAILAPFIGWEVGFADPNAGPLVLGGILLVLVSIPLLISALRERVRYRHTNLQLRG